MAQKTLEEQLAELEMEAEAPSAPPPKSSKAHKAPRKGTQQDDAALKELEELEALEKFQPEIARPASRTGTPKLSASSTTTTSSIPRRPGVATPSSTASARTSEDKSGGPRKSGDSARSFHQGYAPAEEQRLSPAPAPVPAPAPAPKQSGGGWWGGLLSTASATATAARKQAEAAYAEIQKNQEAQRWAEQVRGNVGALRGIGGELGKRALPTFTNILHTLAPPISQHERLQIHITHDLVNYPSLDSIIYQTFSTVMSQVEGGDLMVVQRGSESTHRSSLDGFRGGSSGWNDGPWWRSTEHRDLGVVKGLVEGTKLARVSAETYANEFFSARGGVEEAAKHATEVLSETNPVRSSDIFLAIQPVSYASPENLFASTASAEEKTQEGGVVEPKVDDELVAFAVYLYDPIHSISFKSLSQGFPAKWVEWLDAQNAAGEDGESHLPPEIQEIIHAGGVDPREWVSEWMEEAINLGVGIVAQRYVARRMGVGEGGIGRGKSREATVEAAAGEAARAGVF